MSMSLEIKGCRCSYLYASTHLAKYTFNITKVTNNKAQSYEKKKKNRIGYTLLIFTQFGIVMKNETRLHT